MKKVIAGSSILISGAILFLAVFVAAGNAVTVLQAWSIDRGRFWSAVSDTILYPVLVISVIMMIAGLCFMFHGLFSKSESHISRAGDN